MMRKGQYIVWEHFVHVFHMANTESVIPGGALKKLKPAHLEANNYLAMNVAMAAQTVSESVARFIRKHCAKSMSQTAWYCEAGNKYFDLCNSMVKVEDASSPVITGLLEFIRAIDEWRMELGADIPRLEARESDAAEKLKNEKLLAKSRREQLVDADASLLSFAEVRADYLSLLKKK